MAWILLGVLFSLIATVLVLPRVPAIRSIAGVDGEAPHPAHRGYVLVPSQFGWPEEEEPPSRILTANYRDRWVRPIAMTSDTAAVGVPASFRSVSVIPESDEAVEDLLKRYGPRQVRLYFPEENPGEDEPPAQIGVARRQVPHGPSSPVETQESDAIPTTRYPLAEVVRHGMAIGDACLALASAQGIRDTEQRESLKALPAPVRG